MLGRRPAPVGRGTARLARAVVVGALVSTVLVLPPQASSQASQASSRAADAGTWSGWASSPTSATRKLTPIRPVTDPATVGVVVDPARTRQKWLGVGASLTDSSVTLLAGRSAAWKLLYDPASASGARLNLLRLPTSGTDFSTRHWSFGWDARTGKLTSTPEARRAAAAVVAVAKLRPGVGVVAVPWSAPASMKSGGSLNGGALRAGQEKQYGRFLLAQVAWLKAQGVPVKYLSIVNEPGYATPGYPTMTMTDKQMAAVARQIAPTLTARGVGLWAVDHNFADRGRVNAVLKAAPKTFSAAAFHCYSGQPSAMKGLSIPSVITECTGMTFDDPAGSFAWDAQTLVTDGVNAGATGVMFWNLALTATGGPKAAGGCENCRGVLTVGARTGQVTPNAEFFTLAHLARAADPGAVNLAVDAPSGIPVVAFRNPDATIGVYGFNPSSLTQVVSVRVAGGAERRFPVGPHEMFTLRGRAGTAESSLKGRILRSSDGSVAFVDAQGTRHEIKDLDVYSCLGGWANTVENVSAPVVASFPAGDTATCDLADATTTRARSAAPTGDGAPSPTRLGLLDSLPRYDTSTPHP